MSTWSLMLFRSNALESNFVDGYYGYGDGRVGRYVYGLGYVYGFGDGDGDGFGDGDGDGFGDGDGAGFGDGDGAVDGPGQGEGWCVPQKEEA